jgi:hypothetical protein
MSDPADDGVPHDDWLRAALRHAPDAQAAPPPAVSDAILRAARAEAGAGTAAPAPRGSILQALRDAWDWLARPPVAAGFATVMLATLITLMWRDRPLEDSLPPREGPPLAQAPGPSAAPAPAPQGAPPAEVARAPATPAPAAKAMPRPAPAIAPREEDLQRRAEAQRDQVLREREATTAAKSQEVERRARADTDSAVASTTAPAGAAARPAPVAPSVVPPAAPPATADAAKAMGESAPPERRSATLAAPSSAAPQAQGFARREAAAPLGMLRTTIATEPERWSWQRDGGTTTPMNTPVMQWVQRVGETARGRWAAPEGPAEVGAAPAATLVLLRDGRPHTTLRLGAGAIEVDGTGPRLRAGLPAAEATALRIELDQATR